MMLSLNEPTFNQCITSLDLFRIKVVEAQQLIANSSSSSSGPSQVVSSANQGSVEMRGYDISNNTV